MLLDMSCNIVNQSENAKGSGGQKLYSAATAGGSSYVDEMTSLRWDDLLDGPLLSRFQGALYRTL